MSSRTWLHDMNPSFEIYYSSSFHVDSGVVFQSLDPFAILSWGYPASTVI